MSTELGKLERTGSLIAELGRGLETMRGAFEKGEDLTPHIESLTNWLEDLTIEGIDKLEIVLEWVDEKLETELAGVAEGLRGLVSELFDTIRELVAKGIEFVKEHPDIFRALATIVVTLAGPEFGPFVQPLLQQASTSLSRLI